MALLQSFFVFMPLIAANALFDKLEETFRDLSTLIEAYSVQLLFLSRPKEKSN